MNVQVRTRINGTCLDAINNFVCLCDSSFTGILCDQGKTIYPYHIELSVKTAIF